MTDRDSVETDRQYLSATRALIANEDHWTTDWLAQTAAGNSCDPHSPAAVAWCVVGAFQRVTGLKDASDPLRFLLGCDDVDELLHVNDEKGHAAVLALLDRAISAGTS